LQTEESFADHKFAFDLSNQYKNKQIYMILRT